MPNCYSIAMSLKTRGRLAEWFERAYLTWQLESGRATIEEFGAYLGLSKGYISQLMGGHKRNISRVAAFRIAEKLSDYTILDILGYARPGGQISVDQLPPDLRLALERAAAAAEDALTERGLAADSPEAEKIVIEIFEQNGFKFATKRTDGSAG